MAGRLSYSIAINLLTENFKKGTNQVKNAFRTMQAQVMAFAAAMGFAGVGISEFFSNLITVARDTSKATTALKNVSESAAQYADNLRFITRQAQKYGVYVNDLTKNFAKFTAAAGNANMPMEEQRKLFEALSRASTAFGLSADETNGVFLAVTQMMGKGKIQAEELRGQLGERMPIAMQAMAKAAGTTVAGLDQIMKEGKLLSADVLPKFADALNEMLPNVNTDNIETSLNRLRNAFQEFANNTGVQGLYKSVIDGLTRLVETARGKLAALATFVSSMVIGKLLTRLTAFFASENKMLDRSVAAHERAELQKQKATEKRVNAEKLLEATKKDYAAGRASNQALYRAEVAARNAALQETKAIEAAKAAAVEAGNIRSMNAVQRAQAVMVSVGKRAAMALRAIWSTVGPMALVAAISAVIAKLVDMRREAKRINSIFDNYKAETLTIGRPEEVDRLQRLYRIAQDLNENINVRKSALSEINSILNTNYSIDNKTLSINGDINKSIATRIKLLKDSVAVERYQSKKLEAEDKQMEILSRYGGTREGMLKAQQAARNRTTLKGGGYNYGSWRNVNNDILEFNQYAKIAADASKQLEYFEKEALSGKVSSRTSPTMPSDTKKTPLQKEEEKYAEAVKELTNKLNNRAITEEEYKTQLNELNKATYDTLSGMLTPEEAAKNKTYQTVKGFTTESPFDEARREYETELRTYANQLANGAITEKSYQQAKLELLQSTIKAIASMDNLSDAEKKVLAGMLTEAQNMQASLVERPELKTRDTTFDYKKTGKDIAQEELSIARENLENIKAAYNEGATDLLDELNNAMSNVKTLEEALKVAEVKQDVEELSKQLNEGMYSGVKDIASNADRLVSSFSSLRDVFNDEDATAWERIMAVWNAMINTVDAFMSIVKTIETLTEITNMLSKAKQQEAAIDTAVTTTKVANAGTVAAAETAAATTSIVADQSAAAVKKQTATQNVAASTAEGAAEAGKSAAKLPFPWNIVAIGGAIAAAIAAFAAIPKFAGGGIASGSKSGDKNLVRVNGGEMILNGHQQATLFQLANGKGIRANTGNGGEVVFKIHGEQLEGVLNNYNRKTRRGK